MVFADITGQENTVKALSNAINSGRIMHAYLFCGPRGTGKTSSARIFAKSLNCVNGPTVAPCGKCPGCLDVVNSTPVDVIEIDAASNRSVDDARNILEKVQYAPLHGKFKIYIIDEVHMLTVEASNTLLKTLEEPPENVIFILATTESHKVLETIVSRCQRYDFRRITTSDIVKRLDFIAKSEEISINRDALLGIAKNASGGMRDAVALLDQLSVLGQGRTITLDDVNEILGQISYEKILEMVDCFCSSDTEKALSLLNDIHDRGNEPGRVLSTLIQYFRDMLIVKSCKDKDLILSMTRINENIFDKIKAQSENFTTQTIIFFEERLAYHFSNLKENTNKYMWAELCIIDLTTIPKISSIEELTEKVAKLEQLINSGNLPSIQAQGVPEIKTVKTILQNKSNETEQKNQIPDVEPVENVNIPAEQKRKNDIEQENTKSVGVSALNRDGADDWQSILLLIKGADNFFFKGLASPVEISSKKIVLGFTNENLRKMAVSKEKSLTDAVCEFYGTSSVQADFIVSSQKQYNVKQTNQNVVFSEESANEKPQEKQKTETTVSDEKKNDVVQLNSEFNSFVENYNTSEEEFFDENINDSDTDINTEEMNNRIIYDNLSDTAKNIIDLFGGKIIE